MSGPLDKITLEQAVSPRRCDQSVARRFGVLDGSCFSLLISNLLDLSDPSGPSSGFKEPCLAAGPFFNG